MMTTEMTSNTKEDNALVAVTEAAEIAARGSNNGAAPTAAPSAS